MTFLELYTTQLDIELGSSSTQLFTTVARKAAINAAQDAWVRTTDATKRYGNIAMTTSGIGEFDLESRFPDFVRLPFAPSIKITTATSERWIQGNDDFPQVDPEQFDFLEPGWRAATPGTPANWYIREDGGTTLLGVSPAPLISAGETWTFIVPYIADPADLSASTDVPFTVGSNVISRLIPFHQSLAHYAAATLEPMRKNYAAAQRQMGLFSGFIAQYETSKPGSDADQVTFQRNYYREARGNTGAVDPRRWP